MKIAASLVAHKKARIEMLPLIDIVFLLLVFFIYTMLSMAVHRSLPVSLPSSSSAALDRQQILSITVDANGIVSVEKEVVTYEALLPLLQQRKNEDAIKAVALYADRNLRYQELFRVLDILKEVGLEQVALQTDADQ